MCIIQVLKRESSPKVGGWVGVKVRERGGGRLRQDKTGLLGSSDSHFLSEKGYCAIEGTFPRTSNTGHLRPGTS